MKHPHPGRIAEVYRRTKEGKLVYVGYTAGPFASAQTLSIHPEYAHPAGAEWNPTIQGWVLPARERPKV